LGTAILQLFDAQPLREQIIASIAAGPGAEELDRGEVARLIARARHVEVVPSFQCNVYHDQQQLKIERANMELMLATARMNLPTNIVHTARQFYGLTFLDLMRAPWRADVMLGMLKARRDGYCRQEVEQARSDGHPGDLIVLLSDRPRTEEMAPGVICSPLSWARYCERSKQ
jgi:Arc/MetJ family transcription regulator